MASMILSRYCVYMSLSCSSFETEDGVFSSSTGNKYVLSHGFGVHFLVNEQLRNSDDSGSC